MANYTRTGIVLTQGATVGLPTITMQIAATEQQVEVVGAGDVLVPDGFAANQSDAESEDGRRSRDRRPRRRGTDENHAWHGHGHRLGQQHVE